MYENNPSRATGDFFLSYHCNFFEQVNEFFLNLSISYQKYGFGIRDPGSGKNLFRIPDPGSKKEPDLGFVSATLTAQIKENLTLIDVTIPKKSAICFYSDFFKFRLHNTALRISEKRTR
jgi:hypothetical protein